MRSSALFRDPRARFGLGVLLLAILLALSAPLIAVDPSVQRDIVATRFLRPLSTDLHGTFHLLGTDRFGRDLLSRMLVGSQVSLTVGIIEGIAEATAAITKVFSGALSDRIGKRKELAAIGYGLAALTKPIFPLAPSIGCVARRSMAALRLSSLTPTDARLRMAEMLRSPD